MKQSSAAPDNDQARYALWRHGADLLAKLRATEALDLLIANLTLTDGFSISLSHYPATVAVTSIGQSAIPKLQLVLGKNANPHMRKFAVFCIASIGGARAKGVLTNALPNETDRCVRRFIAVSLEMFSNKVKPNQIPPDDGKWFSAFYCLAE
ncbi:MAG TPA: hypothetical protein VGJ37_01295 [Pyrinomonadaceae bacterium]|jgi:hypothetical protein